MVIRTFGGRSALSLLVVLLGALSCSQDRSPFAPHEGQTRASAPAPGHASFSTAPPVVLQTVSNDWSAEVLGAPPSGWTQIWDPTPYFLIAAEPTVPSGKVLQWSATGQNRNRWGLAFNGLGDITDQEVYTEVRAQVAVVPDVSYMGSAAVRMSGTATDEHGYAVFFVNDVTRAPGSQRYLVLATWVNGYYNELANYPLAWQENTWYSVRLRALGQQISARIWSRGTSEPTTWHLDAWNQSYASGRPGVANHDNGTVQWAQWTASVLKDTATVPPPNGTTYQTTFSEFVTGSAPSGWTATSVPTGVTWSVAADATVSDSRVLRSTVTTTGRHILRLNSIADTTTTQEVLVKMRLGDDDGRGPGIALRHTMDASGHESAYVAYLRSGIDQIEIDAFVAGGWQSLGAVNYVCNPGVWYWMRFRAEGGNLHVNVWADGTPEPTTWTLNGTSGALPNGSVGLYTYEPNVVDYDGFSVATGGLSAPAPTSSSPPPPPPTLTGVSVAPTAPSVQIGASVQFQAIGTMSDGSTTSPNVTWSATGGTISSSGLFTAGTAPGTYQVTATEPNTSLSGATTVVVTAIPPSSGITYQSTFSEFVTGATPSGWTPTSSPANVAWSVAADATVSDSRVLRSTVTTTGRHILRLNSIADTTTTQEVLVKMRLGDDDDRGPGVALRHTMNASGNESAYVAYLRSYSDQVEINAFIAGGWQFIGATGVAVAPGVWYWMRFRAEGTTLKVRVWPDGAAEPSAWALSATNSALPGGSVGLYTYEPNVVDYDAFSVATGGLSAPAPTASSPPPPPPPPPTLTSVSVAPTAPSVQVGGSVQFQATGTMSDGSTTSPNVTWSATGGTISSSGLFTAGTAPGTYQVTATEPTSGLSATTSVVETSPPPAGTSWQTGFASYTPNSTPSDWTATSAPANTSWLVVPDATAIDGFVLRNTTTVTGRHILRWNAIPDTTTTQEVLVRMRLGDDDDRGPGVALRHTMSASGSESAYVAYLRSYSDQVEINAFIAGGWQFIGATGVAVAPGVWYWMRFRAEGTTLKVRVWADGTAEPSAWTLTASNSSLGAGSAGVYVYEPNTVDFDQISIATSGGTAP